MHDIKYIRSHPDAFDAQLTRRGVAPISSQILDIDSERRKLIHQAEDAKAAQNAASKEVGAAKARGDEEEFERLRALVAAKKTEVSELETEAKTRDADLQNLLMTIPNLPFDDVPEGADEADNVEIHRWGTPRAFGFTPKEHYEIDAVAPLFDFERAGKLSGARFVILTGALARLQRAIGQFMINTHVDEHGLEEVWTPVLVKDEALLGTGQLPKFTEDLYQTREGWWLIPTAEVTLTNLSAGDIVDGATLPREMTAYTQCFRSEAGSAGRDTAGMLRQHQFEKVEMVTITTPEQSDEALENMLRRAESILERLEIPYRTVVLCTGDMGFGARKTYDIEAWLPGQNTYREISSCSNCGDFQARRMNTRYRDKDGNLDFIHSLNGSGLAVGRCLIAVLENGQQEDGSVQLPTALAPYLGGKTRIDASGNLV